MVIRRLDPTVLSEALARARGTAGGVVVFDLDSTLLDNRPRQARILSEFGTLHGLPALEAARPEHYTSWDLRDAMRAAGLDDDAVDKWADTAKAFWRERFFTSEYCRLDEAINGAVDYVRAVADTGAVVTYCTGRHEAMRAGTVDNFARLGFPLPDTRVHLLMKPTFEQTDDAWKEEAYARLRAIGSVIAVFDNEPTHINGYRTAFPSALCVHLATDHSGRPVTLLDGIPSIKSF
jgi:phosphoglycolate phosphatase-like HAD superfamily hydrolase